MPKISAQGKASDPFGTVNHSIRPFIGDLRLQERVSDDVYSDGGAGGCQSLRIVKMAGKISVPAGVRSGSVGA